MTVTLRLLQVRAVVQMDLGSFFHIISVHVDITDVNDNPPTFSQPLFQITVPENAPVGATFPLPTAFDKDTGTNNTVRSTGRCRPLFVHPPHTHRPSASQPPSAWSQPSS